MAGTKWFHYARDFLPASFASNHWDWSRAGHFPRSLLWSREEGQSRFYRLEVLLKEIRSLSADVLCLVELDCFEEFQQILGADGYDAVFQPRPGKHDGCGIFWRREVFESVGPCRALIYALPANDRIAVAQLLVHRLSRDALLSLHQTFPQALGYQASEAQELVGLIEDMSVEHEASSGSRPAVVVCSDLNSLPGSEAYRILTRSLKDAGSADSQSYVEGAFTTLKPDVYYFAPPRGQYDAQDQWHWQEGRHEVIDYIFYSPDLGLLKPITIPHMKKEEIGDGKSDMEETSLGQLKVPVKPDAEAFHDEGDLMESPLGTPRICGTVDGWNGNYKRVQKRQRDEQGLQQFLKQFGFQNCTASKIHRHGAFRTEEIYPIHVAARLGNYPLLRLLVCEKGLYGYWSGGWRFPASPVPQLEEHLMDPYWRPPRRSGELQLGIPNRLHGSDHLPVVCEQLGPLGSGEEEYKRDFAEFDINKDNQIDFQEFRIHLRGELDEIHLRRMLTDPARVEVRQHMADQGFLKELERLQQLACSEEPGVGQKVALAAQKDPRIMQALMALQGHGLVVDESDLKKAERVGDMPRREPVQLEQLLLVKDLQDPEEARLKGNEHFKAGRVSEALAHYEKGLELFQGKAEVPAAAVATLLSNAALCYLKLQWPERAKKKATTAIVAIKQAGECGADEYRDGGAAAALSLAEQHRLKGEVERLKKLKSSAEADMVKKQQEKENEKTAEVQRLQGTKLKKEGYSSQVSSEYLAEQDFSHWALQRVKEGVLGVTHTAQNGATIEIVELQEHSKVSASITNKKGQRALYYDMDLHCAWLGKSAGSLDQAKGHYCPNEMKGLIRVYNIAHDTKFELGGDENTSYMYQLGWDQRVSGSWAEALKTEAAELFDLVALKVDRVIKELRANWKSVRSCAFVGFSFGVLLWPQVRLMASQGGGYGARTMPTCGVYLVTGATDGIGRYTAELLVKQRHVVLVHGRSVQRVKDTVARLERLGGEAHGFVADLSLMSDVRKLAQEVSEKFPVLHGLLNNAGTFDGDYTGKRVVTSEGNENVMAPFLLSSLLMPTLKSSGSGRLIVTASMSAGYHQGQRVGQVFPFLLMCPKAKGR
eukprot:g8933.t1